MAGQDESHTNLADLRVTRRDAVPLARGTVLAGRYEIETTVGRGGAGVVLRAYDRELREGVAIKVLHPELSQETRWIERLAREVKLARQLRHPNVCRVFDFEKADGHVFIVMELAKGGSLRHELHNEDGKDAARGPEARLADARAVAEGLAAIHQAGIAHRDVTPQNVLRMADGRLVVSDFGLATEISRTTASVHGGTIAYMAPEVVRGQRADFAADVWSLGVVVHEIMFGARPTWSKATGGAMLTPIHGRTLAKAERLAYDVCRACTAERPGDRPASATEVAAWLGGRRQSPRRPVRRWIALALLAAVALGGAAGVRRLRRDTASASDLELTGEPADWTDTSSVLATVEGKIHCLSALPGREAVRFAWGKPNQVDDLDLDTRQRGPSLLVPEARKEGCAQPSRDGKHLAYQGYVSDGRAFAFVSDRLDGSGALPVVPISDPSLRSDPVWLSNSKEFLIDIDPQHAGVFSLETHRTKVLHDVSSTPSLSVFRAAVGSTVFVLASVGRQLITEVVGFEWPMTTETTRFQVPGGIYELASPDGKSFFTSSVATSGDRTELWRAEPAAHSLKRVATVRDQDMGLLTLTGRQLVFVTRRDVSDAWRRLADGRLEPLTNDGDTIEITTCGRGFMAVQSNWNVTRLDGQGRSPVIVDQSHDVKSVACSPDGATWYTIQRGSRGMYRCSVKGCSLLAGGESWSLAVSPNGDRLAFVRTSAAGLRVEVMAAAGGEPTEVTLAGAPCSVGWSSDHAIWVPRRLNAKTTWVEVDVDSHAATGRTREGTHDCSDGFADPESPVQSDVKIVVRRTSQVRAVPLKTLGF